MTDWSGLDPEDHETIIAVVAEEEPDRRSSPQEGEEQPVLEVQQCQCDPCRRGVDIYCNQQRTDSKYDVGLCYDCDDKKCNGGCTL